LRRDERRLTVDSSVLFLISIQKKIRDKTTANFLIFFIF
jgi:hypothetical protein